jgi:hypothetical protein
MCAASPIDRRCTTSCPCSPLARTCSQAEAPQQRLDACHEFQHREGLGQVVVGAQLQAKDAVHLARPCADDDDRRVARHGAGAAADLEAVHAGQHQVEHQRVPMAALQFAQARVAVRGVFDHIAFVAQVHAQQFGDVGVVLDDQHAFGSVHGTDCPANRLLELSRLIELCVMNRPWGAPKNRLHDQHRHRKHRTRCPPHPPAVDAHHALAQCPCGAGAGDERLAHLQRIAPL